MTKEQNLKRKREILNLNKTPVGSNPSWHGIPSVDIPLADEADSGTEKQEDAPEDVVGVDTGLGEDIDWDSGLGID